MNRALAVVLVTILASPLEAQVRRLAAGGLRSLNEAVERLAERHGWRICYEETVPIHAEDVQRGGVPRGGSIAVEYDPAEGAGAVLRRVVAEQCDQRRLACSVGASPTGVRVRDPVAWVAFAEETKRMKPTGKAIPGMVSELPGRNVSEPTGGLDK